MTCIHIHTCSVRIEHMYAYTHMHTHIACMCISMYGYIAFNKYQALFSKNVIPISSFNSHNNPEK